MRWPAHHKSASHQLKRWSDCSFSCILRVMNDMLSLHTQFQWCDDLIWTNTNSEVGMFYQVTWAAVKTKDFRILHINERAPPGLMSHPVYNISNIHRPLIWAFSLADHLQSLTISEVYLQCKRCQNLWGKKFESTMTVTWHLHTHPFVHVLLPPLTEAADNRSCLDYLFDVR